MTMLATLTRGTGPRQWQAIRSADNAPTLVFFRCPFCSLISTLDGGAVSADGRVAQTVTCPTPLCQVTFNLQLEGWASRAINPPTAFVPAFCHDGEGC